MQEGKSMRVIGIRSITQASINKCAKLKSTCMMTIVNDNPKYMWILNIVKKGHLSKRVKENRIQNAKELIHKHLVCKLK